MDARYRTVTVLASVFGLVALATWLIGSGSRAAPSSSQRDAGGAAAAGPGPSTRGVRDAPSEPLRGVGALGSAAAPLRAADASRPPWTFSVRVIDEDTEEPIPGAFVEARAGFADGAVYDESLRPVGSGHADGAGAFRFALDVLRDVSPRALRVAFLEARARAPGYARSAWFDTEDWRASGPGAAITVLLDRAEVVRGRVVDASGRAVAGAVLNGCEEDGHFWAHARSDERGEYELAVEHRVRERPTHLILATHQAAGFAEPSVLTEEAARTGIGPDIVLDRSLAVLRVRTRFANGAPAADVPVHAQWLFGADANDIDLDWRLGRLVARVFHASSDQHGWLEARSGPPGTYEVRTGDAVRGGGDYDDSIRVATGGEPGTLIVPFARVRVRVVDGGGIFFGDARVSAHIWEEPEASRRRDEFAEHGTVGAEHRHTTVRILGWYGRDRSVVWTRPGTFCLLEARDGAGAQACRGVYVGHGQHEAAVEIVLGDGR